MTPAAIEPGCGRTLEELTDYLHTSSSPHTPHIKGCPECQSGLAALRRLDALSNELLEDDTRQAGSGEEPWLHNVLENLRLETKARRTFPLPGAHPADKLSQTEGAVTALIRAVGDTLDGALIGKCRFTGDPTIAGAPIAVEVHVTAFRDHALPELADTLRHMLTGALATHTELNVTAINITVSDLLERTPDYDEERPTR